MIIQAENTIGIRVPTNVQTEASHPVVVMLVTRVSITTIPITPVTAESNAPFILFIIFSSRLVASKHKKRTHPKMCSQINLLN
jgi:hypothetical protein